MDTVQCLQKAVDFVEDNLLSELKAEVIASQAYMSGFYFQKVFSIVCGQSLGEYIRHRRLSLAAAEIQATETKIIDIAFKYGYESAESFSRAFARFHGISPKAARSQTGETRSFAKISVYSILGGKTDMNELKQRGYRVKENGPAYYTEDMDKTAKWFEEVLGWYTSIDERNDSGAGIYGCATPIPDMLVDMKLTSFNGIHLFRGKPSDRTVAFLQVEGLDALYAFVKKSGWAQITEVKDTPWGARDCEVTTVDGSVLRFFE